MTRKTVRTDAAAFERFRTTAITCLRSKAFSTVDEMDATTTNPAAPAPETADGNSLILLLATEIDGVLGRLSAGTGGTVAEMARLRRWCETSLTVAREPGDQYLLFFLSVFFQDVFFNLVGDVPYSPEVEKCRQDFFQAFKRELETLAKSLRNRDWSSRSDALQNLVSCYLNTITQLNQLDSSSGEADDNL